MSRIVKIVKTLRNHWKKSTFAACLLTYGGWYLNERRKTHLMMRAFCERAKTYGDEPLPTGAKPRHVTVILNPTSKDGKGKVLYEKYAAPLFHLAGIRVSCFLTEHEGQAKSLMEVLDNTDAVVIAGGDGTLHEAVTGLMSREDFVAACKRFPMGVIPAGKTNSVAKLFSWEPGISEARWVALSAMAIVTEQLSKMDVIKAELQSDEGEEGEEREKEMKTVYSLGQLEQGVYHSLISKIPKYWYFGPLKARAALFFGTLKGLPETTVARLSYCEPCSGCSRCFDQNSLGDVQQPPRRHWWSSLIHRAAPQGESQVDLSKRINEDCGTWQEEVTEHSQLDVSANPKKDLHALHLKASPPLSGRWQLFSECLRRYSGQVSEARSPAHQVLAREAIVDYSSGSQHGSPESKKTVCIDSVEYKTDRIHLKLVPGILNVYRYANS
uniref:Acylglycerol kinase, mitochondrial n=1 Tax=Amblyomma aureolatum TaxID=187763 RepID=A0A1E1XFA3_9ACAR